MPQIVACSDENDTKRLAISLAGLANPIDCLTLTGDLGTGKTVFARALIQALAGDVTVQSPTFLLVVPYMGQKHGVAFPVQHFDLYRLKHSEELIELGLEEMLQTSLCLIEWPEIAEYLLPDNRLDIHITQMSETQRRIELAAKGNWQERLSKVYFSS